MMHDLVKIGIIGPESSGKSTLAQYLSKRYQGVLIPEYARAYVENRKEKEENWRVEDITWDELCSIARHQVDELKSIREGLCFFDTELIITKVWFDYAFSRVPEWLIEAINQYPMDVYLLTYPDLPWVADKARSNGSDAVRKELFDRYEAEIQALNIPYYIIRHA